MVRANGINGVGSPAPPFHIEIPHADWAVESPSDSHYLSLEHGCHRVLFVCSDLTTVSDATNNMRDGWIVFLREVSIGSLHRTGEATQDMGMENLLFRAFRSPAKNLPSEARVVIYQRTLGTRAAESLQMWVVQTQREMQNFL